ncbi:hypothetical protein TELCIR_15104 [Teladorsagia circumcincta]|uniref:Uncharacterized protein n=1 Tax=Teladorsagia circumcincta TaxID=45464 RepID=A0A2G9TZ44_TELCI|nr:hypothetical protein TELCIR_15104 [Teladorsagia circumcincta]
MASTSGNSGPITGELDLEALSAYEDALDESETELKRLCEVAAEHLTRERPRPQAILLPPMLRSPSSTTKHTKRSSSSEHSSIEKLPAGQASTLRGRRPTNGRKDRSSRGGQSGSAGQKSGSDHSESPDDWRMVNYTFQEVTHYPVLMQINQQMQMLSRQLYEIESTNALQLKIIAQLLAKLIKARQRPLYTITRVLRFMPLLFFILFWPLIANFIYKFITRRRQGLGVLLRYM